MLSIKNLLDRTNILFPREVNMGELVYKIKNCDKQENLIIHGQFSICHVDHNICYLIRDRLGVNKMFYGIKDEELLVANTIVGLVTLGVEYDSVLSVPPGSMISIDLQTSFTSNYFYYEISRINKMPGSGEFNFKEFSDNVLNKLNNYFDFIIKAFNDFNFVVCLSGGLDSTIIALLAKDKIKNLTIASFSFVSDEVEEQLEKGSLPEPNYSVSEDFQTAKKIAETISVPFLPVLISKKNALQYVDKSMILCQDWRDFNVHCSLVNYILGDTIRKKFKDQPVVVFTGDLMNEYMADYTSVKFEDKEYYKIPRISKDRLRNIFVHGLDTSDRETGVFHHFNITVIQPYSVVCEDYLGIPKDVIEQDSAKEIINSALVKDKKVQKLINKNKVRAQVGGKDGGVLGLFHEKKLSQEIIMENWQKIFKEYTQSRDYFSIIYAGRYISA